MLAGCGSSQKNSAQTNSTDFYSVVVLPVRLTLNSGDWASISATVYVSVENNTPKAVTPPPPLKFYSSDPRVTISPAGEVCAGQWEGAQPG